MNHKSRKYYLLAFIEGALVLSLELLVSRFITPYFGSSLYVITSVLGLTMIGLLIGYYLGSNLVQSKKMTILPYLFIGIASLILILIPVFSTYLVLCVIDTGLILGIFVSTAILLGIPLVFLGAVSPILIELLHNESLSAGEASGRIFAISTLGGVLATFIVGLYLIPEYGSKISAIGIGLCTGLISILLLINTKSKIQHHSSLVISFILLGSISAYALQYDTDNNSLKCIYESDGLLGNLKVCDLPNNSRVIINNGTIQSKLNLNDGYSHMMYTHAVSTVASFVPKEERKRALLIGLAGGSIVKELLEMGFLDVTVVDIDSRTEYVSSEFFNLNKNAYTFIEDDGRHFIKTTNEIFDVIIIDASASEQQPYHLYTNEAVFDYKGKLSENGIIAFNILDFLEDGKGVIVEKVADALSYYNLSPRLLYDFYPINQMDKSKYSTHVHERILLGSPNGYFDIDENMNTLNECCLNIDYTRTLKQYLKGSSYDRLNHSSSGFKDDIPTMEKINFKRIRKLRLENFRK